MHKNILTIFLLLFLAVPGFAQTGKVESDSIPFAPAVKYHGGDGPYSVFCADLDGDSSLDLAVAGYYGDSVSILKNNGDGTFQPKVDYDVGYGPHSVFCADLDGDTALDLAVANFYSDSVSILKNNGDGTFQPRVDYAVGYGPPSVFCADLDGDGDLDLAVANLYSASASILKNNGDGTFRPKADYGVGYYPRSVFCADLDGDSDVDIAVVNTNEDSVAILLNQTVTDVEDDESIVQRPERSSLSQNHPNPFNQSTEIKFALRRSGFVTLSIYDILGRKVKTLVSEHLSAGYKFVLWEGKGDSGKDVASGIYFYQIKIGDFTETKRLVLLK